MKATGIVRRIDDLGRVVIPKEIRRTMRIREGDPLEIYTDRDGEVIFKKYSPMGELGTFVGELAEALSRTAGLSVAICDRDAVIAAAGGAKKDIFEKSISSDLENLMEQRHIYEHDGSDTGLRERSISCVSCCTDYFRGRCNRLRYVPVRQRGRPAHRSRI